MSENIIRLWVAFGKKKVIASLKFGMFKLLIPKLTRGFQVICKLQESGYYLESLIQYLIMIYYLWSTLKIFYKFVLELLAKFCGQENHNIYKK